MTEWIPTEIEVVRRIPIVSTTINDTLFCTGIVILFLVALSTLWTDYKKRKVIKEWRKIAEEMSGKQE